MLSMLSSDCLTRFFPPFIFWQLCPKSGTRSILRMSEQFTTMAFSVDDLYGGFAQGTGLAKASPSELVLEFIVKDSLFEVLKSRVKEIRIPRSEIDSVWLKSGWFGTSVRIRVKSLKWLAELRGGDNGEVTLHVGRRERQRAAEFVAVLSTQPPGNDALIDTTQPSPPSRGS